MYRHRIDRTPKTIIAKQNVNETNKSITLHITCMMTQGFMIHVHASIHAHASGTCMIYAYMILQVHICRSVGLYDA